MHQIPFRLTRFSVLIALLVLLASCAGGAATPTPTGVVPEPSATPPTAAAADPSAEEAVTPESAEPTGADAAPDLTGTSWQWIEFQDTADLNNITVDNPANYTLTFNDDGSFNFQADCNVGNGSYTQDASSLTLQPGPVTAAACPEGSLDQEFLRRLPEVATFVFDDNGNLVLNLRLDSGNMVFEPLDTTAVQPTPRSATGDSELVGTAWQWLAFEDTAGANNITVDTPQNYTIGFGAGGELLLQVDCNRGAGSYTQDGSSLTIEPVATTRMACAPDSLDQEFVTFLTDVASFVIEGDNLVLNLRADAGNMVFEPAAATPDAATGADTAPDLTGTSWQWIEFQDTADLNNITVDSPANYTLTFNDDGSFNFQADCNVGNGSYTQDASSLTLQPGPVTAAACPEGSLDQEFLRRLPEVATFVFDDNDNLVLNLRLDSGNMVFEPAATATDDTTPDELVGTTWQWIEFQDTAGINNITVDTPANYTITFEADGMMGIQADCNIGNATYTRDDTNLSIELGISTLVACPEDSLDDEFRSQLEQVASFVRQGDSLALNLQADGGNMIFRLVPTNNELANTTWQWLAFEDTADLNNITVDNTASYTMTFNADGSLNFRADCNVGLGSYSVDDSSLTIELGPVTLVACPEGSLDQEFLRRLPEVATFVFDDNDNLVLNLRLDSGNMVFEPAP